MKAKRGFTLVEILIVVVILGILAAIVIPQFTQASTEAKLNSLCSDLQTLRSQIELFKVQHNDEPPASGNLTGSSGTLNTDFVEQMTYCTDIDGANNGSKSRDATHEYGPYLERVPENPFTNSDTVAATASAGTTDGWAYDNSTGEIAAAPDSTADSNSHQDL
jgi:general secretion pathway protein G